MTPLDRCGERYFNDPMFRAVVTQLEKLIVELEMSSHEIREAAMYACMRVEMRYPKAVAFGPDGWSTPTGGAGDGK